MDSVGIDRDGGRQAAKNPLPQRWRRVGRLQQRFMQKPCVMLEMLKQAPQRHRLIEPVNWCPEMGDDCRRLNWETWVWSGLGHIRGFVGTRR